MDWILQFRKLADRDSAACVLGGVHFAAPTGGGGGNSGSSSATDTGIIFDTTYPCAMSLPLFCVEQFAGAGPTGLSYSQSTANYALGLPITSNSPTYSGGSNDVTFTVSPALPAGLTLDAGSGVITGTPTATTSAANYTVSASNPAGTTTATLNFAVSKIGSPYGSGSDGAISFSSASNVINTYTYLTGNASAGASSVSVNSSTGFGEGLRHDSSDAIQQYG